MQRRKFGQTGLDVSLLGFGCMRLPTVADPSPDSDVGNIDETQSISMICYAIDHGVDYIDTAYNYHGGKSEVLVGKALADGYRGRVKLATKLPVWNVDVESDCDRILDEQLAKLQTDHVDMYLLHALNKHTWRDKVLKLNILPFLDRALQDGRIKYAGFSFHNDLATFKEIVNGHDWDFCQIQLNYMDQEYQAGVDGLRYAAGKGLAVVIMEPLRGGRLARNVPGEIQAIWDQASVKRSPAQWAFRWVADLPEVSVILSGMGNLEEVKENIHTMADAEPLSLSKTELNLIEQVKQLYNQRIKVNCTDCRYCLPCPQEVSIPRVFSIYNHTSVYNVIEEGKRQYSHLIKNGNDASRCVECGNCESVCPQNLPIIQLLQGAHAILA